MGGVDMSRIVPVSTPRLCPRVVPLHTALVCMLLAVACSDNETLTEPRVARPAAAVADRGENSDLFSAPRFDVNVSFVGPVRLGSPMQIAVDVKANLATPQAELRVTLPEV